MQIYKISQTFEEEKNLPYEEKIGEREQFEQREQLNDATLGKNGVTYTAEVLNEAGSAVGERIESSWVANGSVGWFRYKDDKVYEIVVSPAYHGRYFDYFKELRQRRISHE